MILDTKYIVQGKIITNEKLQILGKALDLLQKSDCIDVDKKALYELIRDFTPPTKNKEVELNEDERNDYQW